MRILLTHRSMQEVVNYYRDVGTDIYAMFPDASKAFDKLIYVKLFTFPLETGICLLECTLLALN